MGSRRRSVCAAALPTEAELLGRSQSPLTSMAGTLRSTTNCSLRKLLPLGAVSAHCCSAGSQARMAVAHALLEIAYHMLKRKEDYRELGADHFDRIDANRTRRSLVRRLERLGHKVTLEPLAQTA